jgi:hypothetical protein
LGGLLAAAGLAPALLGRIVPGAPVPPVSLKVEPRAVPRKEGSC